MSRWCVCHVSYADSIFAYNVYFNASLARQGSLGFIKILAYTSRYKVLPTVELKPLRVVCCDLSLCMVYNCKLLNSYCTNSSFCTLLSTSQVVAWRNSVWASFIISVGLWNSTTAATEGLSARCCKDSKLTCNVYTMTTTCPGHHVTTPSRRSRLACANFKRSWSRLPGGASCARSPVSCSLTGNNATEYGTERSTEHSVNKRICQRGRITKPNQPRRDCRT